MNNNLLLILFNIIIIYISFNLKNNVKYYYTTIFIILISYYIYLKGDIVEGNVQDEIFRSFNELKSNNNSEDLPLDKISKLLELMLGKMTGENNEKGKCIGQFVINKLTNKECGEGFNERIYKVTKDGEDCLHTDLYKEKVSLRSCEYNEYCDTDLDCKTRNCKDRLCAEDLGCAKDMLSGCGYDSCLGLNEGLDDDLYYFDNNECRVDPCNENTYQLCNKAGCDNLSYKYKYNDNRSICERIVQDTDETGLEIGSYVNVLQDFQEENSGCTSDNPEDCKGLCSDFNIETTDMCSIRINGEGEQEPEYICNENSINLGTNSFSFGNKKYPCEIFQEDSRYTIKLEGWEERIPDYNDNNVEYRAFVENIKIAVCNVLDIENCISNDFVIEGNTVNYSFTLNPGVVTSNTVTSSFDELEIGNLGTHRVANVGIGSEDICSENYEGPPICNDNNYLDCEGDERVCRPITVCEPDQYISETSTRITDLECSDKVDCSDSDIGESCNKCSNIGQDDSIYVCHDDVVKRRGFLVNEDAISCGGVQVDLPCGVCVPLNQEDDNQEYENGYLCNELGKVALMEVNCDEGFANQYDGFPCGICNESYYKSSDGGNPNDHNYTCVENVLNHIERPDCTLENLGQSCGSCIIPEGHESEFVCRNRVLEYNIRCGSQAENIACEHCIEGYEDGYGCVNNDGNNDGNNDVENVVGTCPPGYASPDTGIKGTTDGMYDSCKPCPINYYVPDQDGNLTKINLSSDIELSDDLQGRIECDRSSYGGDIEQGTLYNYDPINVEFEEGFDGGNNDARCAEAAYSTETACETQGVWDANTSTCSVAEGGREENRGACEAAASVWSESVCAPGYIRSWNKYDDGNRVCVPKCKIPETIDVITPGNDEPYSEEIDNIYKLTRAHTSFESIDDLYNHRFDALSNVPDANDIECNSELGYVGNPIINLCNPVLINPDEITLEEESRNIQFSGCEWEQACLPHAVSTMHNNEMYNHDISGSSNDIYTLDGFSVSGWSCNTSKGRGGEPIITACTDPLTLEQSRNIDSLSDDVKENAKYTVTGCGYVCTRPDKISDERTAIENGYDISEIQENSLFVPEQPGALSARLAGLQTEELPRFNVTGIRCLDGYYSSEGSNPDVVARPCGNIYTDYTDPEYSSSVESLPDDWEHAADYSITDCIDDRPCLPAVSTEEYTVDGEPNSLSYRSFDGEGVTVTCNEGYLKNPDEDYIIEGCPHPNTPYTITSPNPIFPVCNRPCTRPTESQANTQEAKIKLKENANDIVERSSLNPKDFSPQYIETRLVDDVWECSDEYYQRGNILMGTCSSGQPYEIDASACIRRRTHCTDTRSGVTTPGKHIERPNGTPWQIRSTNNHCVDNVCTCSNGVGTVGTDCPVHGQENCDSCDIGYALDYNGLCQQIDMCEPGGFECPIGSSSNYFFSLLDEQGDGGDGDEEEEGDSSEQLENYITAYYNMKGGEPPDLEQTDLEQTDLDLPSHRENNCPSLCTCTGDDSLIDGLEVIDNYVIGCPGQDYKPPCSERALSDCNDEYCRINSENDVCETKVLSLGSPCTNPKRDKWLFHNDNNDLLCKNPMLSYKWRGINGLCGSMRCFENDHEEHICSPDADTNFDCNICKESGFHSRHGREEITQREYNKCHTCCVEGLPHIPYVLPTTLEGLQAWESKFELDENGEFALNEDGDITLKEECQINNPQSLINSCSDVHREFEDWGVGTGGICGGCWAMYAGEDGVYTSDNTLSLDECNTCCYKPIRNYRSQIEDYPEFDNTECSVKARAILERSSEDPLPPEIYSALCYTECLNKEQEDQEINHDYCDSCCVKGCHSSTDPSPPLDCILENNGPEGCSLNSQNECALDYSVQVQGQGGGIACEDVELHVCSPGEGECPAQDCEIEGDISDYCNSECVVPVANIVITKHPIGEGAEECPEPTEDTCQPGDGECPLYSSIEEQDYLTIAPQGETCGLDETAPSLEECRNLHENLPDGYIFNDQNTDNSGKSGCYYTTLRNGIHIIYNGGLGDPDTREDKRTSDSNGNRKILCKPLDDGSPCENNGNCLNGGTVTGTVPDCECECENGYTGDNCEIQFEYWPEGDFSRENGSPCQESIYLGQAEDWNANFCNEMINEHHQGTRVGYGSYIDNCDNYYYKIPDSEQNHSLPHDRNDVRNLYYKCQADGNQTCTNEIVRNNSYDEDALENMNSLRCNPLTSAELACYGLHTNNDQTRMDNCVNDYITLDQNSPPGCRNYIVNSYKRTTITTADIREMTMNGIEDMCSSSPFIGGLSPNGNWYSVSEEDYEARMACNGWATGSAVRDGIIGDIPSSSVSSNLKNKLDQRMDDCVNDYKELPYNYDVSEASAWRRHSCQEALADMYNGTKANGDNQSSSRLPTTDGVRYWFTLPLGCNHPGPGRSTYLDSQGVFNTAASPSSQLGQPVFDPAEYNILTGQ